MKNTIRRILGMALALIMVFGSIPAFAAEIGDTVKWYRYMDEDYKEYVVTDKIDVNDALVFDTSKDYREYCYVLEVDKSGYYGVNTDGRGSYTFAETFRNDIAYLENNYCLASDEAVIYYLEKGETFLRIGISNNESYGFSLEFIDSEITSVSYDQKYLENLIIGCEVAEDHNVFQLEHFGYIEVTFSSGRTFDKVSAEDIFAYDAPLKEGKNTGVMVLPGHDEPITFTAYPVSKYVESMEISNIDNVLSVKKSFLGEYIYHHPSEEIVTVNFTDGTSIEVQPSPDIDVGMDFINGHHYRLKAYHNETDDGVVFTLGFGKHMFAEGSPVLYSAPCKIENASLATNLEILNMVIGHRIDEITEIIKSCTERMTEADSADDIFYEIKRITSVTNYRLKDIAEYISTFINFYI